MWGLLPALRSLVDSMRVEILNVCVGYRRADIGESPGDSLVVADNYVGHSGQSDSGNIQIARFQVRFIQQVRHLVAEMHIVREQWFAGDRVRAGDSPVVRSVHRFRSTLRPNLCGALVLRY